MTEEYIEKWPLLQTIRTLPTWFCDTGAKFFDGPQPPMEALLDPDEVIQTIVGMPSADVVEVVRCKDCKWYKTNYSWNGKEHKVCVIEPYEPIRDANDFCSRGERKDG